MLHGVFVSVLLNTLQLFQKSLNNGKYNITLFFVIFFVFIKLYFTYFYKPKHDQIGSKYVEIL